MGKSVQQAQQAKGAWAVMRFFQWIDANLKCMKKAPPFQETRATYSTNSNSQSPIRTVSPC